MLDRRNCIMYVKNPMRDKRGAPKFDLMLKH